MKRNMVEWLDQMRSASVKKALPILSFPAVGLMGISVRELISDSERQAEGMRLIAENTDSAASVSLMDLSVEAECFGATVRVTDGEVPTVVGRVVHDEDEAKALKIPKVGSGRTGLYVDALKKAVDRIHDRPVFAGVIGSFSLAARLLSVEEIMIDCYDDPDTVHLVLEKATAFLIDYCKAYKAAGANGIVLAEPVTGLLSPSLAKEFSTPYIRKITDAVQDEHFIILYHNCGNHTLEMIDTILETGAAAYHFGNAVDPAKILERVPSDTIVMGNVDPAGQFFGGTPESIRAATLEVMERCGSHKNFIISSGCDIPPLSDWANIRAFFAAVKEYYDRQKSGL
ncbi:MAG: uroporphyrinogen decarboxylase family protein [Eubacteriales bacterium]